MAPRSQAPERGEDASASFTLLRVWPSVTAAPGASRDALERCASLGLSSLSSETGRQKDRPHGRNEPTCAHNAGLARGARRHRDHRRHCHRWLSSARSTAGSGALGEDSALSRGGQAWGPPCQHPQRRDKPDPPGRREFAFLSETARRPPWSLAAGRVPFPSRLWGGAAPTRVRGLLGRTLCWASARAHAG